MMLWILRTLLLCWWGGCGMLTAADESHIWAYCPRCGKIAGKIERPTVRWYMRRQRQDKIERAEL